MNSIKTLQTNLAIDLVKFEEFSINETLLNEVEKVYQSVYDLISKIDQKGTNEIH